MSNTKQLSAIFLTIITALVAVIVWLWLENGQLNENKEKMLVELEQQTEEKTNAVSELTDMLDQYDNLQTTNDTLNNQLYAERQKIEKLIKNIKNVKAYNSQQISEYKKEVATLRKIMRSYIVQIDSLYTQNNELIAENKQVKYEYSMVIDENENLASKNDSLAGTVEKAQVLKALNISIAGLNVRGKNTSHASKLDKLKTCFTIGENAIAPTGSQYVYLRVADPSGKILTNSTQNLFNYQGSKIAFSDRAKVNYVGKDLKICVFWTKYETIVSGTYTVDIFFQGNIIGTKSIVLR